MLIDRSYNFEQTWKLLDNFYYLNMNFYDSFNNFSLLIGSSLNLVKYSLEGMLPYDLSKIEEILQMQKNMMEGQNDENSSDSD